jgi:hypothetical protein
MKVGDRVKINYRGEPAYRYSRSEDHPTKGFYYENGDEAVVIDPNYYKQEIREHTNLAGYTFPISVTLEGVLVLIDGEQVVIKEKDLEKVIVESEECPKGTHESLDEALGCWKCQNASLRAWRAKNEKPSG